MSYKYCVEENMVDKECVETKAPTLQNAKWV